MQSMVEEFLQKQNITYTLHEHPAVFTCEEAAIHCSNIPGMACKNLVLQDKKLGRYFLVVLPAQKRLDLKKLTTVVDAKKLSFATAETLREKLTLEPGSVSPFGILHNHEKDVELCIDEDVYQAEIVSFHPNINTATVELSREMFQMFLNQLDNTVRVVSL